MTEEAKQPGGTIEVIRPKYQVGKPVGEEAGRWAPKLTARKDILKYLETAEHYDVSARPV